MKQGSSFIHSSFFYRWHLLLCYWAALKNCSTSRNFISHSLLVFCKTDPFLVWRFFQTFCFLQAEEKNYERELQHIFIEKCTQLLPPKDFWLVYALLFYDIVFNMCNIKNIFQTHIKSRKMLLMHHGGL